MCADNKPERISRPYMGWECVGLPHLICLGRPVGNTFTYFLSVRTCSDTACPFGSARWRCPKVLQAISRGRAGPTIAAGFLGWPSLLSSGADDAGEDDLEDKELAQQVPPVACKSAGSHEVSVEGGTEVSGDW
jgi:hypothetical protein